MTEDGGPALVTVAGPDGPGIAARLFAALAEHGADVVDVEQVQVHGRLLLCVEVRWPGGLPPGARAVLTGALDDGGRHGLEVSVLRLGDERVRRPHQDVVTVLASDLGAAALSGLFGCIAGAGGNVDRIVRLSSYPVTSYELAVSGADPTGLRRELSAAAARLRVDVAVQTQGLHRRAKHLIVLDADSTLLQGEVIDLLAARAGHAQEVADLTAAAMAGALDFERALRQRAALLAGLRQADLDAVRHALLLAPGARTLVRTLRRLGFVTAVVSGGFVQVIDGLVAELGIDHLAANSLEVVDGRVTGRLVGPIVDRAGKAAALVRFAGLAGVPLSRTVAVGDGANDLDMLAAAGLGIAYNAKPVVRDAADTALTVPYLDAVLYLLGITRDEIEAADRGAAPAPADGGA